MSKKKQHPTQDPNHPIPCQVIGWIANHARSNFWRVAPFYELDDLIADGVLLAYKCYTKYGIPGLEIDHAHYMTLVKRSFHNHIGDLLRKQRELHGMTKTIRFGDILPDKTEAEFLETVSEQDLVSDHDFVMMLSELPVHLRKVVDLFFSDEGAKKLRKPLRVRFGADDETLSERLGRLAGFPADMDFETELRAWIADRQAV